jgi:hypothetical protein
MSESSVPDRRRVRQHNELCHFDLFFLDRSSSMTVQFAMRKPSCWSVALVALILLSSAAWAQQPAVLKVGGAGFQGAEFSAKDLAQMPRLSLDVRDPHGNETQHYEGVRVSDLLAKAGVPLGDKLRGKAMAMYVLAQASDGYAVVYSIAEIDPAMCDGRIIVADQINGKPLDPKEGPFKIIVPQDKRPARWIRMLTTLTVESAVNPSESSLR